MTFIFGGSISKNFSWSITVYIWIGVAVWASLVAQMVKNLPAMQETWARSLYWEDPLGEGMATRYSSWGWRVGLECGTKHSVCTFVPQYLQGRGGTGSRTSYKYQNPLMLMSHIWSTDSQLVESMVGWQRCGPIDMEGQLYHNCITSIHNNIILNYTMNEQDIQKPKGS